MIYDYSGYCILSVKPSDSAAVLLELNQFKTNMEVTEMNEELRKALSDLQSNISSEIGKVVETNAQVSELEKTVSELNAKIDELNAQIVEKEKKIDELNKKCSETEACAKQKDDEMNACAKKKDDEMNAKCKELNEIIEKQEAELNEIKKANKISELNSALSVYSDEQKDYAKDEIEAFNADPFSVEINSITTKIDAVSYKKIREDQAKKTLETNSMKNEFDGILSSVDPIVKDDNTVDDFDCFA